MNTVYNEIQLNSEQSFKAQKQQYDKRSKLNNILINDTVYLHTSADTDKVGKKLKKLFVGPYTVVGLPTNVHADIKRNNSTKVTRVYLSRLKLQPYTRRTLREKHDTHDDTIEDDISLLLQTQTQPNLQTPHPFPQNHSKQPETPAVPRSANDR